MKEVNEERFGKKPELIRHPSRASVPSDQPIESGQTSGQTDEPKKKIPADHLMSTHVVRVPDDRRTIRHPFNIYEDQLLALKAIQRAEAENARKEPTLAQLAQRAFEAFIRQRASELKNIHIVRE